MGFWKNTSGWQWVNLIASVFTIIFIPLTLTLSITSDQDKTSIARGLAIFLCLMTFTFLVLLIIEEFRWRRKEFRWHRKARYAEAMEFFHKTNHAIRDGWWHHIAEHDASSIQEKLEVSLKEFAAGFSLITGVHCRACIKQLYLANPEAEPLERVERDLRTKTICRSEESAVSNKNEIDDWLTDNSDFLVLFREPNRKYFVGNDLVGDLSKGYKNSHWSTEDIKSGRFDYRSTFVWPIRKALPSGAEFENGSSWHPNHDVFGYLCIDTQARNVFNERYDLSVGAAVADCLYPFLTQIRDSQILKMSKGNADTPRGDTTNGD